MWKIIKRKKFRRATTRSLVRFMYRRREIFIRCNNGEVYRVNEIRLQFYI